MRPQEKQELSCRTLCGDNSAGFRLSWQEATGPEQGVADMTGRGLQSGFAQRRIQKKPRGVALGLRVSNFLGSLLGQRK